MSINNYRILSNPAWIAAIITIIVIIITAQIFLLEPRTFFSKGVPYTRYNNYTIFKQSYFHLIGNKDLYQPYPEKHNDYYKYSPSFSLMFFALAYLPDEIGLFLWNLLNALVLFFALWKLPFKSDRTRLLMLGMILIELLTTIRNSQSNGLIAGMIVFAFLFLEKKQTALASLFIVLTVFIKIFGLVALSLFMLYPNKVKAIIYTCCWMFLLAILPLTVISFSQLSYLYHSWLALLQNDHDTSYGLSVAGWLNSWFGMESKNAIVLIGAALFCLPFLNHKYFHELRYRLFYLSSVLIWIVIFNHKAESPTFVLAVCGVAIWYFSQQLKTENVVLLLLTLVFTVLSPTDLFTRSFRDSYVIPYVLKAVPCILVWIKICYDLIFYKTENNDLIAGNSYDH